MACDLTSRIGGGDEAEGGARAYIAGGTGAVNWKRPVAVNWDTAGGAPPH
jgi:hypothetical protein